MAQQDNFDPLYAPQQTSDNLRKFSDELLKMKGRIIELYIGDQYESLNFDDYSQQQNATIYGVIVEVLDRFIVLDCFYYDTKTGTVRSDNRIYINSFQIKAFTLLDGNGCLDDIFMSAKSAEKVRKAVQRFIQGK